MNKYVEMILVAALLGTTATSASAMQRDPAFQAARDQGLIGEKPDGYLGYVASPSPAIDALVKDLNIKRKDAYTKAASANGATVEEMAFRNGCRLIAERVAVGEKYQTPAGSWVTKSDAAPVLDPRCP
jgi:uncharacterized protein YdbL (DUF1318 family)